MKEKISIIVPVYNVEKYVRKCLESIIHQTYKNIEIIIIDDGSTDNSLKICKEFEKKDKRIIVIHQENQGLSASRNNGIKLATGDYIGFIDSDDIVSPYMYEYLYKSIIKNKSDISSCQFSAFYEGEEPNFTNEYYDISYTSKEALIELIKDKEITSHAVDKLYKKELFNEIEYPIGKKFEDINTTYKLFQKSKKISFVKCDLYGYLQRDGSITRQYKISTTLDFINAVNERYENLYNNLEELNIYLDMNRVNSILRYFLDIVEHKKIEVLKNKKLKEVLNKEINFGKKIFTKEVRKINRKKRNLLLRILFINKYLFYYTMICYFKFKKVVD